MKEYLKRQKDIFSTAENNKLSNLTVMIAGTGGLGTHQAQQLQRIGINKIYLYDNDKVELSNLNRQIFYGRKDIGNYKVQVAKNHLDNFDLDTKIVKKNEKINKNISLPSDLDIIFDALDNFETRFILEKLALKNKIPLIHGGVNSWYGQIAVILAQEKFRLKNIFNTANNDNSTPNVLSPVVSVVASLQVIEGLKVYLKREDVLKNQLILIDLLTLEIDKIKIVK
ncbi:MAG: HesA/MoeB/ThiF family protein [Halanaerobiales bacterium]|nr:HesA/MoeB/ThiF family protein [Halanaerobiales bacterium]